jgi:hypothetical protein
MKNLVLALLSFFLLAVYVQARGVTVPSWIDQSNFLFEEFNLDFATIMPEAASQFGFWQFDKETTNLQNDMETRNLKFTTKWLESLRNMLKSESDPDLKSDIQVMLTFVQQMQEYDQINKKVGKVSVDWGPGAILGNVAILLYTGAPDQRKKDALERFHRYVRGFGHTPPILMAQQKRIRYLMELSTPKIKFFPRKQSLQKDIYDSEAVLSSLKKYLASSGLSGWESDFSEFQKQTQDFNKFLIKEVMPFSRANANIPREIYAYNLKTNGIDVSPEELIKLGQVDYENLYPKFTETAKLVSERNHLSHSNPAAVMAFLRQNKVVKQNDVLALYNKVGNELSSIIREHDLITLPSDPLLLQVMTPAESSVSPIPHLDMPPIVGNQGEKPVFKIPASEFGPTIDDFSYEAAAYSLLAHEGRPGHDLQIRSLIDPAKISKIRGTYAFNSTNIEGWGMYSEMVIFPFLTPEQQLAGLQLRLLRIIRMIMEPQLELGLVSTDQISAKIQNELGYTKKWSETEAWRYSTLTGQAPTYQFGYRKIDSVKNRVKKAIGESFNDKCFNDGYISMGLLPIDTIGDRLVQILKCDPATIK